MQFELFVAARYLRAKRRQAVIGIITVISIVGVAAGVASLIIALAINNGFRQDLQDRLLGSTSHINLLRVEADGIRNWQPLLSEVREAAACRRRSSRHLRAGADLARGPRPGRSAQGHHSARRKQGQRPAELRQRRIGRLRCLGHAQRRTQPKLHPTQTSPTLSRPASLHPWRPSCSAKTWPTNSVRPSDRSSP